MKRQQPDGHRICGRRHSCQCALVMHVGERCYLIWYFHDRAIQNYKTPERSAPESWKTEFCSRSGNILRKHFENPSNSWIKFDSSASQSAIPIQGFNFEDEPSCQESRSEDEDDRANRMAAACGRLMRRPSLNFECGRVMEGHRKSHGLIRRTASHSGTREVYEYMTQGLSEVALSGVPVGPLRWDCGLGTVYPGSGYGSDFIGGY